MLDSVFFFVYLSLVVGYFSCFGGLFITSWVRDFAEHYDFVDRPDGKRKKQKSPVALGGGIAIFFSAVIALGMLSYIYSGSGLDQVAKPYSLIGLACAAFLLTAVGLYDDVYQMRGVVKLLWQLVAAFLIVTVGPDGLWINNVEVFGVVIPFGLFGIPIAVVWILAAINSVNLIDGMDGLATTVGLIFSITIGVMALMVNHGLDAIIAFAMAGALLGFLRHNWPPAKIYLGDSGSMLIGVVLGTLALRCQLKDVTTIAVAGPLAIWAIPIIDSAAALVRRKLTGRSMYVTDRGHIHHRLLTRGLSNRQALSLISGLCIITSLGAIASVCSSIYWHVEFPFGLISFALVIILLVGTRIFGHSELVLLNNRILGFGRSLFSGEAPRSSSVQLQGSLDWEEAWEGLVEAAERFHLTKIRLNLYLPQLHEDFYASWQHKKRSSAGRLWAVEFPLTVDGQNVGMLKVSGLHSEGSSGRVVADFSELVEPLEAHLTQILALHISMNSSGGSGPEDFAGAELSEGELAAEMSRDDQEATAT